MSEMLTRWLGEFKIHRWQIILVLCLLLLAFGGKEHFAAAKDIDGVIQVGDLERTYHVHLPTSYDEKVQYPLVIALHGAGGQGNRMSILTGFSRLGDQENFIVVYPDGYKHLWTVGWMDSQNQTSKVDDISFIREMINDLSSKYTIDQNRIYATGMSMGGMFSHRLAIQLSDRIAAIAPVSGTMPKRLALQTPSAKMPVLMIHGTGDPIVPYEGGHVGPQKRPQGNKIDTTNLSVMDSANYWAKNNGCQLKPVMEKLTDDVSNNSSEVMIAHYKDTHGINDVWVYTVKDGGHTWPRMGTTDKVSVDSGEIHDGIHLKFRRFRQGAGLNSKESEASSEFDAAKVIWQFFKPLRKGA